MAAPTTTLSNGRVVATGFPKLFSGHEQNIQGGPIAHAAAHTAKSIANQAYEASAAGATQRGSGRRRRTRGGMVIDVPMVAEGNTIPGVSYAGNQASLTGTLNALKTGAIYDSQAGKQPYKIGGTRRRLRSDRELIDDSDVVPTAGKRRRRTKKHARSRSSRNRMGRVHRRIRRVRRNTRRVHK